MTGQPVGLAPNDVFGRLKRQFLFVFLPALVRVHVLFFYLHRWAREVMGLIELEPGLLMRSVFSFSEIYSGSKVRLCPRRSLRG